MSSKGGQESNASAYGNIAAVLGSAGGSKFTITDMMLASNANLTYSAESSPEKGDLLSNWTQH